MTEPGAEMQFNALTDAWLPLVQAGGSTLWASPVEVLCGEKDGSDLDYPRDDFRIYARLLLSALVQVLFPAKDKRELEARLATPLTRAEVKARITAVLTDFDLFGPTPFLQIVPRDSKDKGAAPFVFGAPDLYQPSVSIDGLSLRIALVTMFAEQTYAGGAGRGYGTGPGGQPGVFTLVDPGTIRQSAWANTLALESAGSKYAPDGDRPWSNVPRSAGQRASIGIGEGLFFQPRGIWLTAIGTGICSLTGIRAPLVRLSPLVPKSSLARKPATGEDVWVHPCAPLAVNSQGIAPVRLNAARPAWTGLAQLLDPLSKRGAKPAHPLEGPAPVLRQWKALGRERTGCRLLVLDFERDKANVKRRFFEAFPLTRDLLGRAEVVERLRGLVAETQDVAYALERALTRAHDDRRQGGLALADARSAFWASTETPFWGWLDSVIAADAETDAGWEQVEIVHSRMLALLRRTAVALFDLHAEMSEFDPRKQERVAKARRWLLRTIRPEAGTQRPAAKQTEVTS